MQDEIVDVSTFKCPLQTKCYIQEWTGPTKKPSAKCHYQWLISLQRSIKNTGKIFSALKSTCYDKYTSGSMYDSITTI